MKFQLGRGCFRGEMRSALVKLEASAARRAEYGYSASSVSPSVITNDNRIISNNNNNGNGSQHLARPYPVHSELLLALYSVGPCGPAPSCSGSDGGCLGTNSWVRCQPCLLLSPCDLEQVM